MQVNLKLMRKLITIGTPRSGVLLQSQPAVRVPLDSAFHTNLDALIAVMRANAALGVAAPQIDWAARVFCIGQPPPLPLSDLVSELHNDDGIIGGSNDDEIESSRSAAEEITSSGCGRDENDPYAEAKEVPFQVWVRVLFFSISLCD